MSNAALRTMTGDQLLKRLVAIGLAQEDALLDSNYPRFNRLYDQMREIDRELRARGRDARLLLLQLFDHPNIQVRLNAAALTLGIVPTDARKVLETIAASKHYPQAAEAGMLLGGFDDGTFNPT